MVCTGDFVNHSENYMGDGKCFILCNYEVSRYKNNHNNANIENLLIQNYGHKICMLH
jgi:hypothetical protein